MREIFFVRHGEGIANITKEFSYNKVDQPLTVKGRLQAEQTGIYLNTLSQFDRIYTSPLMRTKETAQIIQDHLEYEIELLVYEPIRELNVGILEELGATEEAWNIFFSTIETWKEDPDHSFPKGESLNKLRKRFKQGVKDIFDWMGKNDSTRVIVVSHGGILFATIHDLFELKIPFPDNFEVPNCSITRILDDKNSWHIVELTSIQHLQGKASEIEKGIPANDHFG